MDWKSEAIDKLQQYEAKRQALISIPMELAQLEAAMTGVRSSRTDSSAVKGGGSGYEDRMLSLIVRKEELGRSLECTQLWVDEVAGALKILNQDERRILDTFFVIGEKGAANRLASALCADPKTIYRWRDTALRKFTIALYGAVLT